MTGQPNSRPNLVGKSSRFIEPRRSGVARTPGLGSVSLKPPSWLSTCNAREPEIIRAGREWTVSHDLGAFDTSGMTLSHQSRLSFTRRPRPSALGRYYRRSNGANWLRACPFGLRAARAGTIVLALMTVSWPLVEPGPSRAIAAQSGAEAAELTAAQLSIDLDNGTLVRRVPVNLRPPLSRAWDGGPAIGMNGCTVKRAGVRIRRCIYGDTTSHVSVVVFGDSHAAMWWPALILISKQQHWRLIDLTKAGCPRSRVRSSRWHAMRTSAR